MRIQGILTALLALALGLFLAGAPAAWAQLTPDLCYRGAIEGQFANQQLSSLAFRDGKLYAAGYDGQRSLFKIDLTDLRAPQVTRLADTQPLISWPEYSGLSGLAVDAAGNIHACGSKYYVERRSPPLVYRPVAGTLSKYTALDVAESIWSGLDNWGTETLLAGSGASDGSSVRLYPLSTQTLNYASSGYLEYPGNYQVDDLVCLGDDVFVTVHNHATKHGEIIKFSGGKAGQTQGYTGQLWTSTTASSDYGYFPNGLGSLSDGRNDYLVWCNFYTGWVEIYGRATRRLMRTLGTFEGVMAPPRDACMGRIGGRTYLFISHAAGGGVGSGIYIYELAPTMRVKMTAGRCVQVDSTFAYYKNRSADSIASEVALNGFNAALYMMFDERYFSADWIAAFHEWGVGVWAGFPATCFYTAPALFPVGSNAWKIQYLDPNYLADYSGNFSFIHPTYRTWYKNRLKNVFRAFPFDGFLFFEAFYSNLGALEATPIRYGDVSPAFQSAFKTATGNTAFPNFTNSSDPHYYKTDTALYQDLIDFRVEAINSFYNEIVNGVGGVRSLHPEMVIGTWTLGGRWSGALAQMREEEGQDTRQMVQAVRPDIHYVQSHWPDWSDPSLPPEYVAGYAPFAAAARQADPQIPVGVQADIGSNWNMIRSKEWYERFVSQASRSGVDTTTYYMFSLRGQVYFDPPEARLMRRGEDHTRLAVYFDQVVDPATAQVLVGRSLLDAQSSRAFTVQSVTVDGNIIWLKLNSPVPAYMQAMLNVGGVGDWPAVRFHSGGTQNFIASGTQSTMTVWPEPHLAAANWTKY